MSNQSSGLPGHVPGHVQVDDRLKHLYDYTKFHIGMYVTLMAGLVGIFGNATLQTEYALFVPYAKWSIVLFLIAGAFGGLIASSIPYFTTFDDFMNARLGPWRTKLIPAAFCAHCEHSAFWIGCCVAVIGLFAALS